MSDILKKPFGTFRSRPSRYGSTSGYYSYYRYYSYYSYYSYYHYHSKAPNYV